MEQNKEQFENRVYDNKPVNDYEEVSEKKTSSVGYVLLLLMVIFTVIISQTVFRDLERLVTRPEALSYCVSVLKEPNYLKEFSYYGYSDNKNCHFGEIDKTFGLDVQYKAISVQIGQIASLNKQISENQNKIYQSEDRSNILKRDYDLSLQEKMAQEQAIMDKSNIKTNLSASKTEIDTLNNTKVSLERQRDVLISQISPQVSALTQTYDRAFDFYKTKLAFYNFKIFLLKLLFVLPFFSFAIHFYFKLKKKNSPYTIILTAILGASSILFLQIVLTLLYEIIPRRILEIIFEFFAKAPYLRYVLYYGSVILVMAIFGGIVYYIQKKVFNSVAVAVRRLKDNKCPSCSFTLNTEHNFCPKCGNQIKIKCESCNNLKIRYLTHCPFCGK